MDNIFVAGVDVGSTTTKVVVMDEKGEIRGSEIVFTGIEMEKVTTKALNTALKKAQLLDRKLNYIITTGYGRNIISWRNESIPEIIATGVGGFFINEKVRSILDIGGQDCKFILIEDKGNVLDFKMNDICAAGTGRFIGYLTRIFQRDLNEIIKKGMLSQNPTRIDSTCGVFAGLEIVNKISQKIPIEDIIAGVHLAIMKRIETMVLQVGIKELLMFSGGVANNRLAVKMLEYHFKVKPIIYYDPQLICSIGAAKIALEKTKKKLRKQ